MSSGECSKSFSKAELVNTDDKNDIKELNEINDSIDDDSGLSVSSSQLGSDGGSLSQEDGDNPSQEHEKEISKDNSLTLHEIECKAEQLANFIIAKTLGCKDTKPSDEIEETLLRCTNAMVQKHEMLFKGMVKKLNINNETAYTAFITVVNELFHDNVVTWGRIVALYAFGGQLALYCNNDNLVMCKDRIPIYLGRFAKDVVSSFVLKEGGWRKLCEEFPASDDIENKVWKVLTWTAVGLGLATATSYLISR